MSTPKTLNISIRKGSTFRYIVRWEVEPLVFKQITAISQTAPVRLTVAGHGLKNGWYAAVTDVKGMTQINAEANKVKDSDFKRVTVIDTDTVEFNEVSAASFSPYKSGGYLRYYAPATLAGFSARMDIKSKVTDTVPLISLTELAGIELDETNHTITITVSAGHSERRKHRNNFQRFRHLRALTDSARA